ncbi:hypothetical protein FOPE_11669 [Fonsecaea pedrosoi]|nr:hypothetical protein FOPE_11669 [Fonsecaea pedrosoi]
MGSYDHRDFLRDDYGPDAYFTQHALSMSVPEASSGLSISLPTTMSCQLGSPTYSNSYCTPRTIAPQTSYILAPPTHGYHSEEAYAITGNSASARGRSYSGASTVSADYSVASQDATPRSPYAFVESCGEYRLSDGSQVNHIGRPTMPSQGRSPVIREKKEVVPKQEGDGVVCPSSKANADNRTFCPHEDCLGEDGSPKKFFSRKADVTRHYKSRHDIKYIDCPKKNCERKGSQGFTRRDHLTEHLRGFHMEKIAKRPVGNTKAKRGEKQASEESNGFNSSSEGLTPPDHGEDVFYFGSGKQGFAGPIDQGIKQESAQSSDEEGDDIFPASDDYLSKRTKRFKNAVQKRKSKAKQEHPIAIRQGNMQPPTSAGVAQPHLHGLSFQPGFTTSQMMPDATTYTTHHQQHQQQHQHHHQQQPHQQHQGYTTGSMISPLYAATSRMDSFYDPSSMPQAYENLPTQPISRYRGDSLDGSHFQSMQE